MYNSYVTSSYTVRCKGPLSFSYNDYCTSCLNEKFYRNPLSYSTYPCCCNCCNCGRNVVVQNNGGCFYPPTCSNGLKQSTLIDCPPHKNVILNGFDRLYGNPFPGYGCFYERDVGERKWKSGKKKFSFRAFEEEREKERESVCDGKEGFDEVETILSLLSEDVSDKGIAVGGRREKAIRKILVDESDECKSIRSWKKRVDSSAIMTGSKIGPETRREPFVGRETRKKEKKADRSIVGSASTFEYESKRMSSREGIVRKKEDEKREEVRKVPTERETRLARVKIEEIDDKKSRDHVEEEREILVRENRNARVRKEESESLSRHEDRLQKARKDMSSCSSYYSISSGEFESDDEIQVEQQDLDSGFRSEFKRESVVNRDDKNNFKRLGEYSKESELVSKKDDSRSRFTGTSVGVESSWRKETEKKLTDSTLKVAESSTDSSIKKSRYREHEESRSEMDFGTNSRLDHQKLRQRSEAETSVKHKHFKDTSEAFGADYENSSSSQKVYTNKDENLSKRIVQDARKHQELSKDSKVEYVDDKGVSSNYKQSETKMKTLEDHSSRKEKRQQTVRSNEQVESRVKHERLIEDARLERISILKHEIDDERVESRVKHERVSEDARLESISVSKEEIDKRSRKQGKESSFIYGPSLESAESQLEANSKHVKSRTALSPKPLQEITKISVPLHIETNITIASSSSQPEARGSSHVKPPRGVVIEEITDERSTDTMPLPLGEQSLELVYRPQAPTKKNEAYEIPLKPIYQGDALGSADRLQKSSEHHVDEFLEKAKNEISSSKVKGSKKTNLSSHGSGVSESKESASKRSSLSSKSKGPSDEMWHEDEASIGKHLEDEALVVNEGTDQNVVVKRSGKSLWNIIGDIVRLRWARHEDHGISSKSGTKSSPNQSTHSDTGLSGHDTEENNESLVKKDTITSIKGSISLEQPKEVGISSGESLSSFQPEEIFMTPSVSLPKDNVSMLSFGVLSLSATNPKVEEARSSHPLTSSDSAEQISQPVSTGSSENISDGKDKRESKQGKHPLSSSDSAEQISRRASTGSSENISDGKDKREAKQTKHPLSSSESAERISRRVSTGSSENTSDGKDKREAKQRKLVRNDQMVKDRFEEWEEAYRLEAEQQKMDEIFMREALIEAKKAADIWEVPVGAVLVQGGKIIARGYNLVEDLRDSTAHAEMMCIREASNVLRTWRLSDTTLYVTLEPCAMCAGAILQARIDTLVWGAPNKLLGADGSWIRLLPNVEGASGSEPSEIPNAPVHPFHPKMVIRRGVLATECSDAMQQFFQRRRKKKEKEEKKPVPSGQQPPSCLPLTQHQSKFLSKMHDAFHILFCM